MNYKLQTSRNKRQTWASTIKHKQARKGKQPSNQVWISTDYKLQTTNKPVSKHKQAQVSKQVTNYKLQTKSKHMQAGKQAQASKQKQASTS